MEFSRTYVRTRTFQKLQPDKGNGIVRSLDRTAYDTGVLNNHHNSRREITTFSQGFKKKGQLDQEVYDAIISEWVTAC